MFLLLANFGYYVSSALSIIPKAFYMLLTGILSLVDLLQLFFRSITGLDGVIISGVNGGDPVTGDLAYNIIVEALFGTQFPALKTAFWSMIVLGIILLCIATFVANLRIEYRPDKDKGNSRGGIVKNFFKALAYIGIIPLATIFGLYLGNVVLKAIDGATTATMTYTKEQTAGLKAYEMDDGTLTYCAYNIFGVSVPTKTTPFSSLIFRASAYSCNRVRDDENFYLAMTTSETHGDYTNVSNFGVFKKADRESSAEMIDFAFSIGAQLQNPQEINKDAGIIGIGDWCDFWKSQISGEISSFNINNVDLVWYYYSMIKFNWIVAFVTILIVCRVMLNLCFDMIGRLVEIIVLFLAMPVLHAMIPLDNEKMAANARVRLISKTIMVYAAVFCINLVYSLIPILQNIKFIVIKGQDVAVINYIINTLILVACLKTVESLIGTLSGFIGTNYDAKGELRSSTLSAMGEGIDKSIALAKASVAPAAFASRVPGAVNRLRANRLKDKASNFDDNKKEETKNRKEKLNKDLASGGYDLDIDAERKAYLNSDEYRSSREGQYKNWARTAGGKEQIARYKREHGIADTDTSHDDEMRNKFMASDDFQGYLNEHFDGVSDGEVARQAFANRYAKLSAKEKAKYADANAYANSMNAGRTALMDSYNSDIANINKKYSDEEKEKLNEKAKILEKRGIIARLKKSESLHRTTTFIGDVFKPAASGIKDATTAVDSTGIVDTLAKSFANSIAKAMPKPDGDKK